MRAIRQAAQETGTDFNFLVDTAARESNFDVRAEARTSSAAGMFQFIEQTWLGVMARRGAEHGYEEAAGAISQDANGRFVVSEASGGELYAAHFLGAGGAAELIAAAQETPDQRADTLFPAAARANRPIFYEDGRARTSREVLAVLTHEGNGSGRINARELASAAAVQGVGNMLMPAIAAADGSRRTRDMARYRPLRRSCNRSPPCAAICGSAMANCRRHWSKYWHRWMHRAAAAPAIRKCAYGAGKLSLSMSRLNWCSNDRS